MQGFTVLFIVVGNFETPLHGFSDYTLTLKVALEFITTIWGGNLIAGIYTQFLDSLAMRLLIDQSTMSYISMMSAQWMIAFRLPLHF